MSQTSDIRRMLKHIAEFFAIEKDIRGRSAEERCHSDNRRAGRSPMHSRSGYAHVGLISQKGKVPRHPLGSRWRDQHVYLMTAVSSSTTAVERPEKGALRRLRRRREHCAVIASADRNLQA